MTSPAENSEFLKRRRKMDVGKARFRYADLPFSSQEIVYKHLLFDEKSMFRVGCKLLKRIVHPAGWVPRQATRIRINECTGDWYLYDGFGNMSFTVRRQGPGDDDGWIVTLAWYRRNRPRELFTRPARLVIEVPADPWGLIDRLCAHVRPRYVGVQSVTENFAEIANRLHLLRWNAYTRELHGSVSTISEQYRRMTDVQHRPHKVTIELSRLVGPAWDADDIAAMMTPMLAGERVIGLKIRDAEHDEALTLRLAHVLLREALIKSPPREGTRRLVHIRFVSAENRRLNSSADGGINDYRVSLFIKAFKQLDRKTIRNAVLIIGELMAGIAVVIGQNFGGPENWPLVCSAAHKEGFIVQGSSWWLLWPEDPHFVKTHIPKLRWSGVMCKAGQIEAAQAAAGISL